MNRRVFSVLDYGAEPHSGHIQTKAMQDAIDACFLAGGGEVQIPAGRYLTGGLRIRSNVTLHLLEDAIVKGVRDPEAYFGWKNDTLEPFAEEDRTDSLWSFRPPDPHDRDWDFLRPGSRWNNALLRGYKAENVAVIGENGSVLDGSDCYDELGEEQYRGPHGMMFAQCRNLLLKGYTIQNTGNWAHNLIRCENIRMECVTALGGHDGIHMSICDNIVITDTEFYTGDDCVAGFDNTNVTVSRCVLNTACSAMRFGGTNAVIEDCHIFAPAKYYFRGSLTPEEKKTNVLLENPNHRKNMLSVFTYYADFSLPIRRQPENIVIRRCRVENADRFIHYNFSGNETWQANRPLRSVAFEDITAVGVAMPLTMYGSPEMLLNAAFSNVDITMREGCEDVTLMHLCHYDRILLDRVTVRNTTADPLIKVWSDGGEIVFRDVVCNVPESARVRKTEEPFICKCI